VKAMPVTIDPPSKNVCPHTCIEKEERKKNFNNNEKREKEQKCIYIKPNTIRKNQKRENKKKKNTHMIKM
jgi:hypothetical protein